MPTVDPLDILLPSSHELLEKTAASLKQCGIEHGPLTLLADVSQNVAITDQRSVFVKVYRRKDGLFEPRNTRIAVEYGASTPRLLGDTAWCSVWEFMSLSPLPLSELSNIMPTVRDVHDNTRGLDLIEAVDYDLQYAVVAGRLTKVPDHPLTSLIRDMIRSICTQLQEDAHGVDLVFTHSDLQLKNMGMSPSGPIVFDWEICKMAPVEFELSKLEENLFTFGSWEKGGVARLYGGDVDEDLLHLNTQLRYTQNIAFHLERHEEEIAQRQFEALTRFTATA